MFLENYRKKEAIPKLGKVKSENREVATMEALSGLAKQKFNVTLLT